jgi:hypothetical protein
MMDPTLCHYCNKSKLDPKDRYFLPSGIEVCKECAARHGKGVKGGPSKEEQKQLAPGSKRTRKEQTAQKLLEQMERNKAARTGKKKTDR